MCPATAHPIKIRMSQTLRSQKPGVLGGKGSQAGGGTVYLLKEQLKFQETPGLRDEIESIESSTRAGSFPRASNRAHYAQGGGC